VTPWGNAHLAAPERIPTRKGTAMRPHRFVTFLLLAALALLGGCASMSEDECRLADWRRIGTDDGAHGYTDARLAEHAQACAKIGIQPNAALWRAGWDQGIWMYCTPQVGWNEGLAGRNYQGVCRGRNEEPFLQAYRAGSEIHRVQSRIDDTYRELQRLQQQLAAAPNDEARHRLRERMRHLDFELSQLRMSLGQLQLNTPRF
jgi:hypothetical protein